jgi:hypothetical protein
MGSHGITTEICPKSSIKYVEIIVYDCYTKVLIKSISYHLEKMLGVAYEVC